MPEAAQPARPLYFHIDMDAFYISVERLLNPALNGRAVIVGGAANARGVVASASYEARRFGVRSAMPTRTAARLCPEALFLPARLELYREYSARVEEALGRFAPRVAMVSVDEAWIELTGCERLYGPPMRAAALLRERILREPGLPCSIGAATSRLAAKVASDWCKPGGLLCLEPGLEAVFFAGLPVGRIPGIGKVTEAELARLGIQRAGQLAAADPEMLQRRFGNQAEALRRRARGEDAEADPSAPPVGAAAPAFVPAGGESQQAPKSISHEHTFLYDTNDREQIERRLTELVERVAGRLRAHGLFARTLTLRLRDQAFRTISRSRTLREASDADQELLAAARRLLAVNYDGQPLRLLGFGVEHLEANGGQRDLLADQTQERRRQALAAIDRLRERHGFDAVRLAAGLEGEAETPEPEDEG